MRSRVKNWAIAGGIMAGTGIIAGVAWALLNAVVAGPDQVTGSGSTAQQSQCQTSSVTFTWGDMSWDDSAGTYTSNTLAYSGIDTACVTLGTADMTVNITVGGNPASVSSGSANNMQSSSGTITLSQALDEADIDSSTVNFIIKDA